MTCVWLWSLECQGFMGDFHNTAHHCHHFSYQLLITVNGVGPVDLDGSVEETGVQGMPAV